MAHELYTIDDIEDFIKRIKTEEKIPDTTIRFAHKEVYNQAFNRYDTYLEPVYDNLGSFKALSMIAPMATNLRGITANLDPKLSRKIKGAHACDHVRFTPEQFDGMKHVSPEFGRNMAVYQVVDNPAEEVEEGVTYRALWLTHQHNQCLMLCEPNTSPSYIYMDKGMYIVRYTPHGSKKIKTLFFKESTLEVWLALDALRKLPMAACRLLQDECYINTKNIRVILLGLEKQLGTQQKEFDGSLQNSYMRYKNALNKEFLNNAENRLLQEFQQDKRDSVERFGIKLTKTTAAYEALTLEYSALKDVINTSVGWSKQFDIYELLAGLTNHVLDNILYQSKPEEAPARLKTLTINGMPIVFDITPQRRVYINEYAINQDEVVEVVRRALCFTDVAEYNKLLNNVSHMSLLVHDALANGLTIRWRKLPPNLSYGEKQGFYRRDRDAKWKNMPRLRFRRDGHNKIMLLLNEDGTQKVRIPFFTGFVRAVEAINHATNFNYTRTCESRSKDYGYSEKRLIAALIEHTTVAGTRRKGADGQYVKGPETVTLTTEQARELLHMSDKVTEKAILKAQEFLKTIVTKVGAEVAEFNGAKGYKVKGAKTMYFVNQDNNQVFNMDSGASICIVEGNNHSVTVGNDELATRLLALKNDSKTMAKIGTLAAHVA